MNAAEAIEKLADGPILGAVIQSVDNWQLRREPPVTGRVIAWDEARPFLEEFAFPAYVWTENQVLFIEAEALSLKVRWIPRNPVDIVPLYAGDDGDFSNTEVVT